jgi:hypothetical protein
MKIKKILSLILCSAFLFNASASACNFRVEVTKDTPTNAALRSALLPGWGQHFNEQYTKGYIVFGVFIVSAFGAFYFNAQADSKYEDYMELGLKDNSLFDDYESDYNTSRILTFTAIAAWVYAVADAYFTNKARQPKKNYVFNVYHEKDAFGIKYGRKF